ncbi:MAG: TraR/DksA family transcriptional regulator [Novosphingobium sp.]|nr:TraR/DksA family transcriptional regulator [Novosphingobium sp.]
MVDLDRTKQRLESRLAELLGRADAIENDLRHPLEADSAEQAIDLADDEALTGTDEVLRVEIHEIRLALARIESGEYGVCVTCGADIKPARLEAQPMATRCIRCAP